jgi:hypothetical protein
VTTVLVDLAAGEVQVGPVRLPVTAADAPDGGLVVAGALLRPLSFAERANAVATALAAAEPRRVLVDVVLSAAVVAPGQADPDVAAAVALALAGAGGAVRLPPYERTALEAGRLTGLSAQDVAMLPARRVDDIVAAGAGTAAASAGTGGEQRILFVADDAEAVRLVLADLVDELLARGRDGIPEPDVTPGSPPTAPAVVDPIPPGEVADEQADSPAATGAPALSIPAAPRGKVRGFVGARVHPVDPLAPAVERSPTRSEAGKLRAARSPGAATTVEAGTPAPDAVPRPALLPRPGRSVRLPADGAARTPMPASTASVADAWPTTRPPEPARANPPEPARGPAGPARPALGGHGSWPVDGTAPALSAATGSGAPPPSWADLEELADGLGRLLADECDLRGLAP